MPALRLLALTAFLAFSIWFVLFLPADDSGPVPAPAQPAALQQAYRAAIQDAEVAEPSEIYRHLTAITPHNPSLIWHTAPEPRRLLVSTWTAWDGYNTEVGKEMALQREAWVTVAPELQDFCREQASGTANLTLRLEQLLGLPPDTGKTFFVELWVKPEDLFRPSADPEITDHEAELEFSTYSSRLQISAEHASWYNQLKSDSYSDSGYPWTRLGYSYDWGNPKSDVGLSEFVIQSGSQVSVNAVSSLKEYCRP